MEKSNKGLIIVLVIIIVILSTLCVLFATNTIELYSDKCDVEEVSNSSTGEKSGSEEIKKEDVGAKIKEKLNDEEWVKDNLYSKENCFDEKIGDINHHLKFSVLHDNNNNPVVIVLDFEEESFILACYRVYYDNGNVIVQNITNKVEHPSHGYFNVDENQGLVLYNWGHMGSYTLTVYDVKDKEIKEYDKYEKYNCDEDCTFEYDGDKTYNPKEISMELNKSNIDTYIK